MKNASTNTSNYIRPVIVIIILLLIEIEILDYLFPYPGFKAIISLPMIFGICSLIIILGIFLTKKLNYKSRIALWIIVFIVNSLIAAQLYPQQSGQTTLKQIGDTFKAYKNYNKINYSDFTHLTTGERVAYIYKFKERLPDKYISLQIDSTGENYESLNPRTYVFEYRKGEIQYDSTQLKLINSDTSTTIIEYLPNSDTIIHKTVSDIFNPQLIGWSENGYDFFRKEDNFEITTGIEKLLYGILERTRKPNR